MKKTLIIIMCVSMLGGVATWSAFAQARNDFVFFSWGQPRHEVERFLWRINENIVESTMNSFTTFGAGRGDVRGFWTTYYFRDGLEYVRRETATIWHRDDEFKYYELLELPTLLSAVITLSRDRPRLIWEEGNYRIWAGEYTFFASALVTDELGYYRVFSHVGRTNEINLIFAQIAFTLLGVEMPFTELLQTER